MLLLLLLVYHGATDTSRGWKDRLHSYANLGTNTSTVQLRVNVKIMINMIQWPHLREVDRRQLWFLKIAHATANVTCFTGTKATLLFHSCSQGIANREFWLDRDQCTPYVGVFFLIIPRLSLRCDDFVSLVNRNLHELRCCSQRTYDVAPHADFVCRSVSWGVPCVSAEHIVVVDAWTNKVYNLQLLTAIEQFLFPFGSAMRTHDYGLGKIIPTTLLLDQLLVHDQVVMAPELRFCLYCAYTAGVFSGCVLMSYAILTALWDLRHSLSLNTVSFSANFILLWHFVVI